MDKGLQLPLLLAGALLVLVALLLGVKQYQQRQKKRDKGELPGLDALLKAGKYQQAAKLAEEHEQVEQAIEYYLRAQRPFNAARLAAKVGKARRAAELFELADRPKEAANQYREAGMVEKAREVDRLSERKTEEQDVAGAKSTLVSPGIGPKATDQVGTENDAEGPERGGAGDDADLEQKAERQRQGAEEAERLLRQGDIQRAADMYRDAGLVDEAVHLYVNVLGAPGEAAPLLAARGKHERAAELYEMAGRAERAAAMWIEVAKESDHPDTYVDRIEGLSADKALAFLDTMISSRPLSDNTVELYYRYALAAERKGQTERATDVLMRVTAHAGDYKDAKQRLKTLRSADFVPLPSMSEVAKSVAPSTSEGDATAPDVSSLAHSPTAPGGAAIPSPRLSREQVAKIAREAAEAALAHASKRDVLSVSLESPPSTRSRALLRAQGQPQVVVVGLEREQVSLDDLNDVARQVAGGGPSIETLLQFIDGHPCELQNIEVYYRLGLAYLARGRWADARDAFDAVEDASPGYRDAYNRAKKIRAWQKALGPRASLATKTGLGSSQKTSRYEVKGELGRGGMAVVYRATDEVLGREVALKFLADSLVAQPEMRQMFEREARSVAGLNHPNIVVIYDFGMLEGKAFICMEYVEGASVENLIDQQERLSVVEALRITAQLLDALAYAHSKRIVHRDIKPSNMMRTSGGLVKLMDFGLAKSIAAGTKASVIAGTPAYMAPEQLEGTNVGPQADLFSVGCSLYEMLTGELPFAGSARSQPPAPMSTLVPDLPEALDEIVARALELDPANRYESAEAFGAPVRELLRMVDDFTASSGVSTAQGASKRPRANHEAPTASRATVNLRSKT